MKKSTYSLKLFLLAALFALSYNGVSQCTAAFNYTLNPAGNVDFASISTGTPGNVIYNWLIYSNNGFVGSYTVPNPSNTFSVNGTYTVYLGIYNQAPQTCSSSAVQTIAVTSTVSPCNLNANFSINTVNSPTIGFSSSLSTGTIAGSTYSWNYGDGNTGSGSTSNHAYTANGIYTITLLVNNNYTNSTCTSIITKTLQICTVNPLQASFIYSINALGVVTLTSTSTNTALGYYYMWGNNNGSPSVGGTDMTQATFSFTPCNSCSAWLQVTDPVSQCTSVYGQSVIPNSVVPCPLNASFTFTQAANGQLYVVSTSTGVSNSTAYTWNFGDGSPNVTGNSAGHVYLANGSYSISLIVVNPNTTPLCADSVTQICVVSNVTPCIANAAFSLSPTGTPQFWNAIPTAPANVIAATWNWGDGQSGNTLYTSHTYSAAGTYSICLTVTVSCGAVNSFCSPYAIYKSFATTEDMNMVYINVVDPATVGLKTTISDIIGCSITPNPNAGIFDLSLTNVNSGKIDLIMYDAMGKLVYEESVDVNTVAIKKTLQLSDMPGGVYHLKINAAGRVANKMVIINR